MTSTLRERRVFRWVFVRGDDRITCELALDRRGLLYEFSVRRGGFPSSTPIDRFSEAPPAFERQCQYEAALIDDGWSLHAYESSVVELALT